MEKIRERMQVTSTLLVSGDIVWYSISLDMLYYSIKIEKIKQKTALFNKKIEFFYRFFDYSIFKYIN